LPLQSILDDKVSGAEWNGNMKSKKSKYELNSSTLDAKFRSLIGVIPDSSRDEFRIPKSWILDSTREN